MGGGVDVGALTATPFEEPWRSGGSESRGIDPRNTGPHAGLA